MNQIQENFLSNMQVQKQYFRPSRITDAGSKAQTASFQDILAAKTKEASDVSALRFSKHAFNRLADRNIELTGEQMDRLAQGTQKAEVKGIRDSLVMVDDLAFIVNVPNQTVITAMDRSQAQEQIFTNIDGAVFA